MKIIKNKKEMKYIFARKPMKKIKMGGIKATGKIPPGCAACGGPYPECCASCPLFDD